MSDQTKEQGDTSASEYGKKTAYKHRKAEMLSLLTKVCGVDSPILFHDSKTTTSTEIDEEMNC